MDIIFLLDASGSMVFFEKEPVKALNNAIRDLAETPDACESRITIAMFNTDFDYYCVDSPLHQVKLLKDSDFVPHSETALYDSIHRAINDYQERNGESGKQVLLIILTDGMDTFSSFTSRETIDRMRTLTETGLWKIQYLGTNQDPTEMEKLRTFTDCIEYECSQTGISGAIHSIPCSVQNSIRSSRE